MRPDPGAGWRVKVYCYPAHEGSAYIPLLFTGTQHRYQPVDRQHGTLTDAIAELDAGHRVIVHVHWEEFVLDGCATEDEADAAARAFCGDVEGIQRRTAPLLWTVHNELPHEIDHHLQFMRMRRLLARAADIVLVHDEASIEVLADQVDLDRSKVRVLPHPSYLDVHEDAATLAAGLDTVPERRIQGFGWIRTQKGFAEMLDALPPSYLTAHQLVVRISGHGPMARAIADRVQRDDVQWDVRHVPGAEAPQLLRSATCVVLPYRRALTSGVAVLAMSVGALVVAVDTPAMRELLPPEHHRFLYRVADPSDLRRTIDTVVGLPASERRRLLEANLAVARTRHPRAVSASLAELYDDRWRRRSAPRSAPADGRA